MARNLIKNIMTFTFTAIAILGQQSQAADSRSEAKRLYSSLTGSTLNKEQATYYSDLIAKGKSIQAAREIVESNKGFYNVTLKDFFTPMTSKDGNVIAPLNDAVALMIGITRDEESFFDIFYKDIMYQFNGVLITNSNKNSIPSKYHGFANTNDTQYLDKYDAAVKMYNRSKNDMYEAAERFNIPMGDKDAFIRTSQLTYTTRNMAAIAGIFSTRQWAFSFYSAGTNRASFAYLAKHFLCREMEELNDVSIPDYRVRRDVDRAPGGSPSTYKKFCSGCHAGQDALGGAFTYYDFNNGAMTYAEHEEIDETGQIISVGPVAPKINRNNLFTAGKIVQSDSWINLWTSGQNAYIGWGNLTSGNGAKDFGKMIAETKQVRTCLTEKVFEKVCFRAPKSELDHSQVEKLAEGFNNHENMKQLFIETAILCMGE